MIRRLLRGVSPVVAAGLLTAAGLALVGWFDYSATRSELLRLLRDQATTLRQTIAAAARSNEAAGAQAEAQVTERLLDNARLLAEVDRRGGLSDAFIDEVAERNRLFRITVFGPTGARERANVGRGFGPQGRGLGTVLVDRLLKGGETEAVSDLHAARGWGGGARIAAGVRRSGGGAIVLNADASDVAALLQQASLENLVRDIAANAKELAYVALDGAGVAIRQGEQPPAPENGAAAASSPAIGERSVTLNARPVLEVSGPIALRGGVATLRLGLRLDGVLQAEQRLLVRLAISLSVAMVVSLLMLWSIWLRRAYTALSGRHALAEAALRRRDRLSAMGELAATVAHEVRNPLNAIAMSAKRLRREFPAVAGPASRADQEEVEQLLGVVESETHRINGIVQQFLDYARPPRLVTQMVDPAALARDVVEANRALAAARGVRIDADVAETREARIDPGQMRQAIENLVRNAVEATPDGGSVRVAVRTGPRQASIEVRDTGSGMDAETVSRMFDLYFTTKADGTGVGLAVTQQIVAAHGGTIEVQSSPGGGTTMTIRLPARAQEAADA